MAKLSQSFNERLAQGRLVDPANDSAKFYLAELGKAEANHPSTQLARQALQQPVPGRSPHRRHPPGLRHGADAGWVKPATSGRTRRVPPALERDIVAAQNSAARQPTDNVVTASQLSQTRYVKPEYPAGAQQRGTGGWVDVTFTVRTDGTVTDVGVSGAEPAGIFEQAAMSAVRRWRYDPVRKDGRAIEQRARVRIRFSVEE